ncbi:flagellar basal body P-ring protein FlgI [Buchnera aphidicola]|uniref:flagellar basal body P-ring protein FlgI n=1 Tax=Buchnera aphidicola TaxID=9 RepID=UPI0031B7F89C
MFKNFFLKIVIFIYINILFIISANAETIKNMTSITNIKETHLIGYGLVIGLNGTGDYNKQNLFTLQSLNNMLSKLNINTATNNNIETKNIASVIVTSKLSSFNHYGDKIDVKVSSIGNATNIQEGILLMTPLKDSNNNIYAIAQGKIIQTTTKNINKNNGKITQGAIIESENKKNFGKQKIINLKLYEDNFTLVQKISDIINLYYPNTAFAINSNTIQLHIIKNNILQIQLMANIENIDIPIPEKIAKITINSKNGIIIINGKVKIDECIIINGNISLTINKDNKINEYNKKKIIYKNEKNKIFNELYNINTDQNIYFIINELYKIGIKTSELISILESIKKSGCLHAQLDIY